ncbi:hypothetical protein [Sediminibacterium sp.]|uniref:hypothetical protein n=1 Tax=Sediminibacterium sp. TaxID=1917865 RepID=UPI0025EBD306|nr:hypothetical protein [Sediminibacterium sp.]MBW0176667.1 hypothetical protein [Sediminibacterium sp.]
MSNITAIRIFNDDGLSEFERIVGEIRNNNLNVIPETLLFDPQLSDLLEPIINIEKVDFKNKNQLVPYLVNQLNLKNHKHLYFDKGLWTWLSAFYFDNICPVDANGKRKINEAAFYILKDPKNYTKYYRHLLAYPSRLYSELGESSRIFLIGTFQKRGEITEQFGAYQEIALNKGILDAANIMYWDETTSSLKRGAAGKGGGSARRMVRIIRQYQMTYDLNSMSGNEIVSLLPSEFSRWKTPGIA